MKFSTPKALGLTLVVLATIMAILFAKSFQPEMVLFSSDGPLGAISAASVNMANAWKGVWQDLNWIGIENPAALPHTSSLFWFLLGDNPVTFSKFQVPISLIALGLSLWVLLRQFGFRHSVCALAAIAAALNSNSFSHACWGLPSRAWTLSSTFLALAALRSGLVSHPWLKALLAGLAVANGIMEGFDVGAIYSLYVAAFAAFIVLAQPERITPGKVGQAISRVLVVGIFSAICAAAALSTLIGTQIQGVSGMEQDAASKQQHWDEATRWSLPKAETTRVLVPGLFGYRMDTTDGGNYWGSVGQAPGYPQTRHSGAGEYAGALVVLLAVFGVANAFRKKNNPFNTLERRTVFFFAVLAFISVLFAWGRHAPFYHLVYALPYFSTIRNPIKFMHPFHMALLILFGFGLEALFRGYVQEIGEKGEKLSTSFGMWWKNAVAFDRKWVWGSLGFVGLTILGSLIYLSSRRDLISYLGVAGFPPSFAEQIASFSYGEAGLAILFIALSVLLVILALSGWFSGKKAAYLTIALGLLLTLDLARANVPWVTYYNYKERYALNPVLDFLRHDAHEHRVTAKLAPFGGRYFAQQNTAEFEQVANTWLQHQFQYYNIQALEPVQMPRPPELDQHYFTSMLPTAGQSPAVLARMWQLSNTRYLIGDKQVILSVIQQLGLNPQDFKNRHTFDMSLKPGANAEKATIDDLAWEFRPDGRFAIFDYTNALPRVMIFPAWQVNTNDNAVLQQLTSPNFDPHTMAFLNTNPSIQPATNGQFTGSATITSYAPKRIEVSASNSTPAILLYNDKYSVNWSASLDGRPTELLRANYIMRGIALPPGTHKIVMTYSQSLTGLFISLVGITVGLAVLIFLLIRHKHARDLNVRSPLPASP
jgi:hypothetical protein